MADLKLMPKRRPMRFALRPSRLLMLRGKVSSEERDYIWAHRSLGETMAKIAGGIDRHPSTVWTVLNPDHVTHPNRPSFTGRGDWCACGVQLEQGTNGNGYRVEGCPNGCEVSEAFPIESRVA